MKFLNFLFKRRFSLKKELNTLKEKQIIDSFNEYNLTISALELFQVKINNQILLLEVFNKEIFLIDFFNQESWKVETKEKLENLLIFYKNSSTKKEES